MLVDIVARSKRSGMPSSSTSTFSEPVEFEAALCRHADVDLLVTEQGTFQARLTHVALHRVHLAVAYETVSRIAFVSMRRDLVLVWWAIGRRGPQIWCGMPSLAGEIVTLSLGGRAHARTQGTSRWAGLWISAADLDHYSRVLTGAPFKVPPGTSFFRPHQAALEMLQGLHAAAIKLFENCPGEVLAASAIHGLEQQLIQALVECLSDGFLGARSTRTDEQRGDLMVRFEDICATYAHRMPTLVELCTALDVPTRTLRRACTQYLDLSPMSYLRLRRMKMVHRALRSARASDSSVAELARRHGFNEPGRFAARYRALFGELPSTTLRRPVAAL